MSKPVVFTLIFLLAPAAWTQTAPAGWKVLKDAKSACQISVPPEWAPWNDTSGAAVFQDTTTALAVVTTQTGQNFQPLTPAMQRMSGIVKEKLFENTAKRVFYQDRTSTHADEPNAYSASVPGTGGTCSCRVVFLPKVAAETVKKIVLSLAPVAAPGPSN
uniref:Uncharacterized protein n=1 Tax=Solibacter usitatus (strain Ellin6076) TaxID=234267 RepID=Q02AD0_SOLUE